MKNNRKSHFSPKKGSSAHDASPRPDTDIERQDRSHETPTLETQRSVGLSAMEDNRDFNQQLTEKFNKGSAVNSFLSADEKDWVSEHGTIRVGYRDNFLPFCDTDAETKELTGTLLDFLSFAETCEKNARLSFSARGFDTTEAALQAMADGEIDCLFPLSLSAYDSEQRGVIITDPLVVTEMFAAVRTADHLGVSPEREMLVAVIKGNPNYETFLMDCFSAWRLLPPSSTGSSGMSPSRSKSWRPASWSSPQNVRIRRTLKR